MSEMNRTQPPVNSGQNPRHVLEDLTGMACIGTGLITGFGLFGLSKGLILQKWVAFLRFWLGWGTIIGALSLIAIGWWLLHRRTTAIDSISWKKVFVFETGICSALMFLAVLDGGMLDRAIKGSGGGIIGWAFTHVFDAILSRFWSGLFAGAVTIISVVYLLDLTGMIRKIASTITTTKTSRAYRKPAVGISGNRAESGTSNSAQHLQNNKQIPARGERIPPEFRKKLRLDTQKKGDGAFPVRNPELPPLDLLVREKTAVSDERNINITAGMIEKTLSEFGLPAKVVGFQVGPTVTQFALEPGYVEKPGPNGDLVRQKVRVSQISALSRDLTLALSAKRLRIVAPVPGRSYIGIEVPNVQSAIVRLRPLLESPQYYKKNSTLAIGLGLDVSGEPVIADLESMPHLLIAGTTGSGKSVCIAAITISLVMNNSPENLRLVMVDPKMVELVRFNGMAHLLGKVETDIQRCLGVLRWTMLEMDRRYKLLESKRSRNINTYNKKIHGAKREEHLPHIVVLVDELADLMMTSPDQTEMTLVRLAQMARATGIHLILATQRPSTDIVTGLIKANFPARISFAVASSVDSRVILDTSGAESLLGRGDMLFLPPELGSPIRLQGVIITDQEIERVIDFWQESQSKTEESIPPWEKMLEEEQTQMDQDRLIEEAIRIVRETQRASTSMLQRRLRVGFPRAARLMDELEELGVVGKSKGGGKEREVLISPEGESETEF